MIFAIDSAKPAKRTRAGPTSRACMRGSSAATLDGKRQSNQCAATHADASREKRCAGDRSSDVALRAAHDIDMRKTSLERPEPDGYMPSLFSTD
ncbi:hypothetical protein [Burkholderia sp. BCC1993]|uniref:hypothetical protein n=1 Tax=Burkholderia sp. BCC1993 TaxID=2817444 RepID=UPI002AB14B15|nr:hypothetical protein [Burkholderia sp. BCC1993]